MDLELWEVILVEELERILYPTNEWDLLVELDKPRTRVARLDDEHAAEAEQLSQRVMRISNDLVDLGLLPGQDVPQPLKSAWEVLPVVDLVLKCLQEALASSTCLSD
jgi:hypothetical protein